MGSGLATDGAERGRFAGAVARGGEQAAGSRRGRGERDPAEVVRQALRLLSPPMDASGLIPATVAQASQIVAQAALRAPLATVVAAEPEIAAHRDPAAIAGHVEDGNEADYSAAAANDSMLARSRRRPGAEVDAREIRAGLGMSQPAFAAVFEIMLAVLRDWEQGPTKPDGAARVLLRVIEASSDAVRAVVAASAGTPAA